MRKAENCALVEIESGLPGARIVDRFVDDGVTKRGRRETKALRNSSLDLATCHTDYRRPILFGCNSQLLLEAGITHSGATIWKVLSVVTAGRDTGFKEMASGYQH